MSHEAVQPGSLQALLLESLPFCFASLGSLPGAH